MNRAVQISLFVLGTFVGSLFMIFVIKSDEAAAEDTVVSVDGDSEAGSELIEEPDWAELELRQREQSERRVEAMTAAAASEPVDPEWGPITEQQITERFASKAPPGFKLLSAICKTSICITEIQSPSRKEATQQLAWSEFLGLSRGFVHHPEDVDMHESHTYRTVVFLAREGRSFPK